MRDIIYTTSLFFLYIFSSLVSLSQMNAADSLKIDSLKRVLQNQKQDSNRVNTLNVLSPLFDHNRDTAMRYADEAILLAKKLDFNNGEARLLTIMGSPCWGAHILAYRVIWRWY